MIIDLNRFDAVVFDLDGTLIDSMGLWGDIDIEFFKNHGQICPSTYQKEIEGMSVVETAQYTLDNYNFPECTVESLLEEWNDMAFKHYSSDVSFKEGALDFLKLLKTEGKLLGIATSNSAKLMDAVSKHLELYRYIDVVVTGEDVGKGKPDPEPYLTAADRLNIKPNRILVFEDLPAGIQSAKAAGMTACLVMDDYSLDRFHQNKQMADIYIHSFNEINQEYYSNTNK